MPDEVDGIGPDDELRLPPYCPPVPHFPDQRRPSMPLFEKAGWVILLLGLLILVYFALTRST